MIRIYLHTVYVVDIINKKQTRTAEGSLLKPAEKRDLY